MGLVRAEVFYYGQQQPRTYIQFKLDGFTSNLQQFGTQMLFVLKKIANQSIVAARHYRKLNNQCFVFMSGAKDFNKNIKVEEKLSQTQPQQPLKSQQSQQTTGLKEKVPPSILPNTMVGEDHNGKDPKKGLNTNTENSGIDPQEKPKTDSNTNENKIQDPKKPKNPQNLNEPPKIGFLQSIKLINLQNFDKFDFKKWIKKEWKNNLGYYTLLATIIGLLLQMYAEQFKQRRFQKKMMKKYGSIQVYQNYIDSPVQEQVRKLLNKNDQNRVKVIAGCSGIGKTTAIKKVLSDMKKDGAEVFYFSFGDSTLDKDQMTEKEQFYGLMIGIIKKFGKQPKYAPKKVKVVLDDINRLEKKSTFDQIMQDIYRRFNFKQIDINCISSSGSFIENQMQGQFWKSLAGKSGSMNIIQNHKDAGKIREFQIQILRNKYGERIKQLIKDEKQQNNLLIEAIVDVGLITRELELFTKEFLDSIKIEQKITIQEAKRLLKSYQIEQIQRRAGDVGRLMVEIKDKKQKVQFLSNFLSSEEQLSFKKCGKMIRDLDPEIGIKFQKVFTELEKKNMIIFCRPRARHQENIFRTQMKKYKKSWWNPFS